MSSSVLPVNVSVHPDSTSAEEFDFDRRFGGIARLYGAPALARFRLANVCIIGVGGVGSWAVEALARSAVGHLTMIDLDNLAESNVNRQIHALTDTLGQAKVTALAERIKQINPYCQVTEVEDFVTIDNLEEMLGGKRYDYVIDAIDNVRAKTAIIAYCRDHAIGLITIGSAGGQLDPTRIEIRDLARTEQEPLLAKVRKLLRSQHRFPRGEKSKFGIDAVFSTEPVRLPVNEDVCAIDDKANTSVNTSVTGLNCAGYGSAVVVTASFGLAAAAYVLRKLAVDTDSKAAL
ncbi:tRNA cyclic N6-threonylcarbamoyladenosine(37) synthase TcdA [Glaciimonas sp. CA11.2]|uniref:tRNA cyclic N6-threonylcarbamoyladenosine(37) synthase TcdA n=1 Tax=unclassified Glaciimonas TaxID=2644401 RepID=UPI002AB52563|nr:MULTISPECIES: tRNA cyclic N6-threonylcarbamoyladenosine(37) synthase TcdA [unclassified Glaciimonas]MDY7546685.1 tRNA cyclic N6-threonylcarbamoyladenosine(37) synthase TcdA [Glaciimonas sp. CA11.2]MEB0011810.1 tRNA cyclic N6-threonylcarbamoyladenosine(37) synthase TcdA [Glaciimonas sp. Cout2]MEB0080634.1 tRNA cyclic N6-threonylcarbamoyladenosine(37) synthase TcdA [Glaciimonas sp. Gout2]MEB0162266.1 tRNA cyclic N6-threonylcarbamoyladenosine(37) synthase TcdA [Glaciimonas sp. CA11.2]